MYLLVQSYGYNDITEELEFTITFSNPPVPSGKRVLDFQFNLPVKFPHTFIEITGSEPFLLSGLRIETTTENWLKTFSIEYAKEYFLSPNKMTPLNEIEFEKLVCTFEIFLKQSMFSTLNTIYFCYFRNTTFFMVPIPLKMLP